MKFRTKKNQKSHKYDEYLAYDESKHGPASESLDVDNNQESDQIEGPLYDPQALNQAVDDNYQYPQGELNPYAYDYHEMANELEEYREEVTESYDTPNTFYNNETLPEEGYPSRQAYLQAQKAYEAEVKSIQEVYEDDNEQGNVRRAKYSAKVDRFLTNGIIVVGVLLIAVLLIAFLV